jgi:chromosome segregation ATPase
MEILFVLAGLVILFFIIGVVLIIKGASGSSAPGDTVPREELVQVQKELGAARQEDGRLKQQLDTLAVELHQAQSHVQDAKNLEGLLNTLQQQETDSQNTIQHLDRSLAFLRQKADEQARAAKGVIEALLIKSDTLSKDVAETKSRFDEKAFLSVKEENQRLQEDVKALLSKVENFERQIAEKARAGTALESELRNESQRYHKEMAFLKHGVWQLIQRIRAAGEEMAAVKQACDLRYKGLLREKEDRLARDHQGILDMEKQLARFQEQMKENNDVILALEQSLSVSRDRIALSDQLIHELQEQLKTQTAAGGGVGTSSVEQSFREERDRLLQDKTALETKIAELREAHEFFQQKEKILQKELTKSRTEAMGFRRICEGYKMQLEKGS